ncbi:VOC family protein [Streptomyces roseirectus]|uniref:VOC family protein n=1 Tax=Streptomyces roseirectus TaxID=2768066 RepID=A0A7H0I9L0_9ACTN|nr:VOC family protein [Streptomyces roseirectus]QNP69476.1 VOC family protein [Streptomyces roseirectus]
MNTIPARLDHLVFATPQLDATIEEFTRRTGVVPAPGGAHVGLGTRNHLVGLGGRVYLEIIGPDPDQTGRDGADPSGLGGIDRARAVTWAIEPPDLDLAVATARARGYDPGDIHPMSRRRPDGTLLAWRVTERSAGLVPFLIDWGTSAHPSASGLPLTPLLSLTATAPDPAALHPLLAALDAELQLSEGPPGISFTLDTPKGPVTFD